MDTILNLPDGIYHELYQPSTTPRISIDHRFVQIEITITLDLLIRRHYCLTDQFTEYTSSAQESLRLHLRVLQNRERAYRLISDVLRRLPVDPTSHTFDEIVDKLIQHGLRIGNCASNMGRKVLPLCADIWRVVTEHVVNENDLMNRALAESESASNNGMVPANRSSVKKMLKRVCVEDDHQREDVQGSNKKRRVKGKDCVICFEEIEVGSCASQMPCAHTFHGDCIEKWLKESHYCPLCRYEMPTDKESS